MAAKQAALSRNRHTLEIQFNPAAVRIFAHDLIHARSFDQSRLKFNPAVSQPLLHIRVGALHRESDVIESTRLSGVERTRR
jgi:hypothetical protein